MLQSQPNILLCEPLTRVGFELDYVCPFCLAPWGKIKGWGIVLDSYGVDSDNRVIRKVLVTQFSAPQVPGCCCRGTDSVWLTDGTDADVLETGEIDGSESDPESSPFDFVFYADAQFVD